MCPTPEPVIKVVIADDDEMVRDGFAAILGAQPDMEVVGSADDGVAALQTVRSGVPDVVVMDVRMPRLDGIEATRRLLTAPNAPKILVVTTFEHDSYVYDALVAGAQGFLLKRSGAAQLVSAVRALARLDVVLFPESIRDLVDSRPRRGRTLPHLTEREQEVLRLLARGMTNAEIAADLFIGLTTAKTHVASLLTKIGARNRVEIAMWAYDTGRVGD